MKEYFDNDILIDKGEIFAVGEINDDFYTKIMKNLSLLEATKKEEINIFLNSCGGDLHSALGIFDRISKYPHYVNIHVYGEVASGASIILQAADKRIMSPNSIMMLHDINIDGISGNVSSVDNYIKTTKNFTKMILDIFVNRGCVLDKYNLKRRILTDWYITSDEAIKLGLIDEQS